MRSKPKTPRRCSSSSSTARTAPLTSRQRRIPEHRDAYGSPAAKARCGSKAINCSMLLRPETACLKTRCRRPCRTHRRTSASSKTSWMPFAAAGGRSATVWKDGAASRSLKLSIDRRARRRRLHSFRRDPLPGEHRGAKHGHGDAPVQIDVDPKRTLIDFRSPDHAKTGEQAANYQEQNAGRCAHIESHVFVLMVKRNKRS